MKVDKKSSPFPNIVIDNFFDDLFLEKSFRGISNLSKLDKSKYQNIDEVKLQITIIKILLPYKKIN